MSNKNEERISPIVMTKPDAGRIACKDCIFRDRTSIEVANKVIFPGVTKGTCEIYKGPPEGVLKPHNVLFNNARCEYYMKDEVKVQK